MTRRPDEERDAPPQRLSRRRARCRSRRGVRGPARGRPRPRRGLGRTQAAARQAPRRHCRGRAVRSACGARRRAACRAAGGARKPGRRSPPRSSSASCSAAPGRFGLLPPTAGRRHRRPGRREPHPRADGTVADRRRLVRPSHRQAVVRRQARLRAGGRRARRGRASRWSAAASTSSTSSRSRHSSTAPAST